MSSTWQQLQALRSPLEFKASRGDELHHHITKNVIPFLEHSSSNALAYGDDKSVPDLLELLSPAEDTLPYLYVLLAQIDEISHGWKNKSLPKALEADGPLWQKIALFLTDFDPVEIRYSGSKWMDLMDMFDRVSRFGKTIPSMALMAQAMVRMDPSAGTFTSTHLLFIKLCLRSHSYREAVTILDRDIHSLPPQDSSSGYPCSSHYLSGGYMTVRSRLTDKIALIDVLQYYLLGAMVYITIHDWTRASFFLEHILSTPTSNTAHALMFEAYKKWVLVGILADGKMSPLPKTANGQAMKIIRHASKAYESIAEAFKSPDPAKLRAEAHEGDMIWAEDANEGLIRLVLEHHRNLSVVRLGQIYAAVPMSIIATKLGFSHADAEVYIRMLIDQGLLKAVLDNPMASSSESIVRMVQNSNNIAASKSEEQLRFDLMSRTNKIKALGDQIREADKRLSLSRDYLDHVRRLRKSDHDRNSPEHETMDLSFVPGPGSDEEESVMADVG